MTHWGVLLGLSLLSASNPTVASEPLRVSARQMDIPFRLAPGNNDDIREVDLFVSRDEGKTWTLAATAQAGEDRFPFKAPRDGVYWFAVRTTTKAGVHAPADLAQLTATLKVLVDTSVVTPIPPPPGTPPGTAVVMPKRPHGPPEVEIERLWSEVNKLKKRVKELEGKP